MKKLLIVIFGFLISNNVNAQSTVSIQNTNDASNFLESYFSPLFTSLGSGLNNGWYNTAKPHKLAGFDITFTLNSVMIPDENIMFNPNNIENFSSEEVSPTILGNGNGATITYDGLDFTMPDQNGIKKNIIPVPMINAGIGIFKKTEINIRYLPQIDYNLSFGIGSGSISLWGAGIKHDLMQWIPLIGDKIPFNMSIQFAHSRLDTEINIKANDINQEVNFNISASNVNLLVSKKILMITGHAGIGYSSYTSQLSSNESINIGVLGQDVSFTPINMNFETKNELISNIGIRFNLGFIALQANHTFSEYPVTTIGAGISIR